MSANISLFELMFEGPDPGHSDAERKVKQALVSDLRFSVDEVRAFFEQAPTIIFSSDSLDEVEFYQGILTGAGAQVYVVKPQEETIDGPGLDEDEHLEVSSLLLGAEESETQNNELKDEELQEAQGEPAPEAEPPTPETRSEPIEELSLDLEDENETHQDIGSSPEKTDEQATEKELDFGNLAFADESEEGATTVHAKEELEQKESTPVPKEDDFDLTLSFDDEPDVEHSQSPEPETTAIVDTEKNDTSEGIKDELDLSLSAEQDKTEESSQEAPLEDARDQENTNTLAFDAEEEEQTVVSHTEQESSLKEQDISADKAQTKKVSSSQNTESDDIFDSYDPEQEKKTQTEAENNTEPEATEYDSEEEEPVQKKKKKFEIPLNLLVPCAIGVAALAYLNFANSAPEPISISLAPQPGMMAPLAPAQPNEIVIPDVELANYLGESATESRKINWEARLGDNKALEFSALVSTPPVAPLSDLEIVRGVEPRIHITRIEVPKTLFEDSKSGKTETLSRIYLNQGEQQSRIAAKTFIEVKEEQGGFLVELSFTNGKELKSESAEYLDVNSVGQSRYSLAAKFLFRFGPAQLQEKRKLSPSNSEN